MASTRTPDPLGEAVAAVVSDALELSHRVHANPEIAFEERQAAAWTAALLERHAFDVTAPVGGLETAFVARWKGDRPGPVIAYAGEYDALPEVGHGCGHNLMCSSSAGAAVAASRILGRDFGGEIRFIGTPAEEAGNGKVHLIRAGVFEDVDVCLQIHPSDSNSAEVLALAITEVGVTFHGTLAHASGDPWLGKNALDAVVLLYTMVAQWRQHLKPGERVHGIITHDAGIADDPIDPNAGSTDMANVSHEVPTIHPYLAIGPRGMPGHSREFAAHAGGEDGDRVLPIAIRILAATGVELLRNPELVDRAWADLEAGGDAGSRRRRRPG